MIAAASVARQTRAAIVDVLQSNYVRTAFAVGHGTRRTVVKYAFKNAAIPTVTVLGLQLAGLIGGVVIIEQIFSIPGLGTYMLRALTLPDVPVIQAVTITFVVIYVVLNLIVDISYGYLNPRVRRHRERHERPLRRRLRRGALAGDLAAEPAPRRGRGHRARRGRRRHPHAEPVAARRSSACSATSRRCSRSRSCCSLIARRGVRVAGRAARPRMQPRHALRDARASTTCSAPTTSAATPSAASSTARRCRCAPGSRSSASRSSFAVPARPARRLPWRRHRRHPHAGDGRPRQLPAARARAGGGRHARRRAPERDPRHLDRDDPRLHAADPRADPRGARGDVHRGVALHGHEARAASGASASCPTLRRRSSWRRRSPSGSRSSPRPS